MSSPIRPPLTVETVDGATVGRPITKIKVTNGTLTVSGNTATIVTGGGGGGGSGTVTSVGLTETGSALTITGSPVTTSGTINIAGAGTSSQVILGDLTLGTLPTGTIGGSIASTQVARGATTADEIEGDNGLLFDGTSFTINTLSASDPVLNMSSSTKSIALEVNTSQKLTVKGASNSFVLDASSATGGITFPDGTTQTTAATSGSVTFPLEADSGSLSAPSYSFSGDTNTGMYSAANDNVNIVTGGSIRATFNSNGITIGDNTNVGKLSSLGANDLQLETNNGTNSGTITITDGVDGDISLSPNGNGAVEISGAYKLPTAVTTDNNYVLTAQTDGTTAWAASGGGGIGGSIADNQVAVGATTADEIEGSSNLTFDGTMLKFGTGSTTAKLSSNGSQDLVLTTNTNAGFTEPYIQLNDSASGNISINSGNSGATKINIGRDTTRWVQINNDYYLPQSDGTANQFIKTNGSGTLSFADAAGGIGGAISDNQVAYGDLVTNDIEGNAKFTYDVTTQSLNIASGTGTGTILSGSSDMVIRNSSASAHSKITLGYDAANSNIKLDTDGTGLVEIHKGGSLAYSLPNVVTTTNDYVLTAQTDGSTAWAAGGGTKRNYQGLMTPFSSSVKTWDITRQTPFSTGSNGSTQFGSLFNNTGIAFCFSAPQTGTPTEIGVIFGSSSSGGINFAIYDSDADGAPNQLIAEGTAAYSASSVVYDTSLTGQSGGSAGSMVAGDLMWCVMTRTDGSVGTTMLCSNSGTRGKTATESTVGGSAGNCIETTSFNASTSFTNTAPAITSWGPQNTLIPIIGVRF